MPSQNEALIQRRALLERRLDSDIEDLANLVSTLSKTNALTEKMGLMLSHFDERLGNLEGSIMPIHKATVNLTKVHENIDKTLVKVDNLVECFDMPNKYDKYISKGPVDMPEYLEILGRMKEALATLKQSNFKASEQAISGLKACVAKAFFHFNLLFKKNLLAHSTPVDPLTLDKVNSVSIPTEDLEILTQHSIQLSSIDAILDDRPPGVPPEYIKVFSDIRSTYLVKSLSPLSTACTNLDTSRTRGGGGGGYLRGESSLIAFFGAHLKMLKLEKDLVTKIFTKSKALPCFQQTISVATDMLMETAEFTLSRIRRSLQKKDIGDIYMLIDIAINWSALVAANDGLLTYSGAKGIEMSDFSGSCKTAIMFFLKDFCEEVKADSPKVVLPVDGTVHEITSVAMNMIRRLIEYQAELDTILYEGWGSGLAAKTFPALVTEILDGLTSNLETKSKGYKKQVLAAIFLMNNYYFVHKQMKQIGLSKYAGYAIQDKFLKAWERQKIIYFENWKTIFDILLDTNFTMMMAENPKSLSKSQREMVKDKFKNFNAEFDSSYIMQTSYTIQDAELRSVVLSEAKSVLIPLYTRFQECCQKLDFSKTPSKYIKYDKITLESALDRFFIGSI